MDLPVSHLTLLSLAPALLLVLYIWSVWPRRRPVEPIIQPAPPVFETIREAADEPPDDPPDAPLAAPEPPAPPVLSPAHRLQQQILGHRDAHEPLQVEPSAPSGYSAGDDISDPYAESGGFASPRRAPRTSMTVAEREQKISQFEAHRRDLDGECRQAILEAALAELPAPVRAAYEAGDAEVTAQVHELTEGVWRRLFNDDPERGLRILRERMRGGKLGNWAPPTNKLGKWAPPTK